mgnify:CR=1 FL=1
MLGEKKLFLLDIDGTICKGNQLIEGAAKFLKDIKENGGQYVFITNNATRSVEDYIRFFQRLGIHTEYTNFLTASYAMIDYLKKHHDGELIYVLGTKSFIRELKKNKIRVTTDCEDEEITCVVISYDNQLTYEKLTDTCKLLSTKKVDYLATNPDYVCPIEFGYVPDCGAICEMLAHAVKRMPHFIGKPEPDIAELALRRNNYRKEETVIVGDRLYTDILCGYNAGIDTVLVLTGEATEEEEKEGMYFKFNVAVILRADQSTQIETLSKGVSNFIYTPNEARAFLDLEAKEGGDRLLGNGASIPVEYTGAQYINNFDGEEGKLYKWIQKTIKEALEKTLQKV